MDKVAVLKCGSYGREEVSAAVDAAFAKLGGAEKFVKKGMRVALKPNLLMKKPPEEAATTHPEIIRAAALAVRRAGGTPFLAESPGGPYSKGLLEAVYDVCGIKKMAGEIGLELNYGLELARKENPAAIYLKSLEILKPLAEADLIINLPKLKGHQQMIYTGAVKNMFGAVAGVMKAEYHLRLADYDRFANAIIDIFLAAKPALSIMDAIVAMEGYGPSAGRPRQTGLVLASDNAFALDLAAIKLIGLRPEQVPITRNAIARGLSPSSLESVEIDGERLDAVTIKDFDMPQLKSLGAIQFFKKGPLRRFADSLRPEPRFLHDKCIGCGICARDCPPHIITMKNNRPYPDLSKCIRCFCCQELCPAKAVAVHKPLQLRFILKILVPILSKGFYERK